VARPAEATADPIRAALGEGGLLERALPGFEVRRSQLEMADHVQRALGKGRALVVEAGTGTGKTLAYLLPAALSGLKMVVSTATKTLQEQLKDKDVPLLVQLGVRASFAFLKGRQNYLCLYRARAFAQQPLFARPEEASFLRLIEEWAGRTEEGDRAELEGVPETLELWRDLTSTADQCGGSKCPDYDGCFVFKARRRAADADVVVVNHALFFSDLKLRSSSAGDGGAAILPRYDGVIFDEAHGVEETATEHFGSTLSSHRVMELARDAQKALSGKAGMRAALDLALRLGREGRAWFDKAAETRGREDRWVVVPGSLAPAEPERRALRDLVSALGAGLSRGDDHEMQLLERRCLQLGLDLDLFGDAEGDEGRVTWAELRGHHLFLHSSPLEVASDLQGALYEKIGPVVFTSATLAVAGSLDYFKQRVGLADESGALFPTDEAVLASPFDYQSNAALYLPEEMPEPLDPAFPEAVADELRRLLPVTGGRAFVLFTSLRNMRAVHERLAGELPWRVLLQGERPKGQLLREFREEPSVLFASQSFWEGVDVAGEALSLVVIDKLPFASPSEPLVAARIERLQRLGRQPFFEYQVPQAALALKQGFGRLIRSGTDRGIVAVLDRRLTAKGYGRLFLSTLPRCRVARTVAEVRRFWDGD